jgi:hypothetical protein
MEVAGEQGEGVVSRPQDLEKPQIYFVDVIDNSTSPFLMKHPAPTNGAQQAHPYLHEIGQLESLSWAQWRDMMAKVALQSLMPLSAVPCTWVDTPEALEVLVEELSHVSEFAFDLEVRHPQRPESER